MRIGDTQAPARRGVRAARWTAPPRWTSTHAAADAFIADCIERFHEPVRLQSHLGYVSPMRFEV